MGKGKIDENQYEQGNPTAGLLKEDHDDDMDMIIHANDQSRVQADGKTTSSFPPDTTLPPPHPEGKTVMYLTLNPGISIFNVSSFYIMQLATYLISNFMVAFFSYLLTSPYYGVPQNEVGGLVGNFGFYAAVLQFIADFGLGTLMDIVGRKWPVIIGLSICGLGLIAMPYGYMLYPNLLILRILIALAMLPGQNAPLIVDYINHKSLGVANGYQNVIIQVAVICATTGALQLKLVMDIKYIFIMVGSTILFFDFILLFGIKDVKHKRPPPPPVQQGVKRSMIEEQTSVLKTALLQFWHAMRDQREFIIAIVGNFCFRVSSIAMFQYGPIYISSLFDISEQSEATSLCSLLLLIANLIVIPLALGVGHLGDKLKIWKLLLLFGSLGCGFLVLMITSPGRGPQLYIGFVGGTAFNVTVLLLSLIMLSKIVKRESRGTLFGAFSCFGDFGIVIINLVGGQLYDNVSHLWPFGLAVIALGVLITLLIIFGLARQLHV